jgi:hypothetical protein
MESKKTIDEYRNSCMPHAGIGAERYNVNLFTFFPPRYFLLRGKVYYAKGAAGLGS